MRCWRRLESRALTEDPLEREAWAIRPLLDAGLRRSVERRWAAWRDSAAASECARDLLKRVTCFTLFWVPVHPSVGRAARVVDVRPELRGADREAWLCVAEENARLYVAWNQAGERGGALDTWEGPFQSAIEARDWLDDHTIPEFKLR